MYAGRCLYATEITGVLYARTLVTEDVCDNYANQCMVWAYVVVLSDWVFVYSCV